MTWEREYLTGEIEHHVLALRELLVRFDQNLAAHRLLDECVPYWAHTEAIRDAHAEQRKMVAHALDDDAYSTYYATNAHERPFEEQYGISPLEAHRGLPRVAYLREALTGPETLLDLSCNDGWMLANLAAGGFSGPFDGLDLNPGCVKRAKQRKKAFPAIGTIKRGDLREAPDLFARGYGAVVLFETLEHLADPGEGLRVAARMCGPDGHLFVSTPLGAVEDGNLPEWDTVEPKGHLWAFTEAHFTRLLEDIGDVEDFKIGPDRVMWAKVSPVRAAL